jgi:UPF0271 protein
MNIDLNCDAGESYGVYTLGADREIMPFVTSVNVACAYHAGDPRVMDATVALAASQGVAVGAHPGYPDRVGFGRRAMSLTPEEIETDVLYQIGALAAFCRAHSVPLVHVKAHGALYNTAAVDRAVAAALARGIARWGGGLVMVGLANSVPMAEAAATVGLPYAREAFADRTYNPDGTLQSRHIPGSLIVDPAQAAAQAVAIAKGYVVAHDGTSVALSAETICLHGDNPAALANARAVREALAAAGVTVRGLAAAP